MPPTPLKNASFHFENKYITLLQMNEDSKVPQVLAKAQTEKVLGDIFGPMQPVITAPLAILPRGVRYISNDRTLYAIEYPAGPVDILLPKWMAKGSDRFAKVYMPKHFLCIKLDDDFGSIIGAAISLSYDYNYTLKDQVQSLFGMAEFEIPMVPTPNICATYNEIGEFLASVHERVFSHALSLLTEEQLNFSAGGPSMPMQYTESMASKKTFMEFWVEQGEMAYEWTFEDPVRSDLSTIMYLETPVAGGIDVASMDYLDIIIMLMDKVREYDELPFLKKRDKAISAVLTSWKEWRRNNHGANLEAQTPLMVPDALEAALLAAS